MDFDLSPDQLSWQSKARSLGRGLAARASAIDVVRAAAGAGLAGPAPDRLAATVAIEALAFESSVAGISLALHGGVAAGLAGLGDARVAAAAHGETVGAIALSADEVPSESKGLLSGRARWVAPLTSSGVAIVGARGRDGLIAAAVVIDGPGVTAEPITTAGLSGLVCGHLLFDGAPSMALGATMPIMALVRLLLTAAGLGIGRRALYEALIAAQGRTGRGAGGEQTVQGLLADAATELDAATLLTWKAATASELSLADASMAKLAATEATQRAVARATQVVGADSFRSDHIVERLAQDVRALELFAGRTEALREAVALDTLPRS
jgi:alkylation response protein AidB-like acyl-CoA dehydrogenase